MEGFDKEGAQQLHHQLVDSRKWIGTAELYVAFVSRGIPTTLVDFHLKAKGPKLLFDWIVNYFSQDDSKPDSKQLTINDTLRRASPITVTDKLPLILQHHGHSRTIVGYEKYKNGTINLLTFDPSRYMPQAIRNLGLSNQHLPSGSGKASRNPNISTSKVFDRILHPHGHRDRKRKASDSSLSGDPSLAKRMRAGGDPEVIVLDDEEERAKPSSKSGETDYKTVLKTFRLTPRDIQKKDKYQILYFPMTEPLTEEQRMNLRTVTSIKLE